MTADQELKREALEMATKLSDYQRKDKSIIDVANEFYAFLKGDK